VRTLFRKADVLSRMYTIVVGVDEDEERAVAQGQEILDMPLDRSEVQVTVVHAFEDNPEGASVTQVGSVREIRELLEDAGIAVELEAAGADPAAAITNFADREEADLVVVAGRKRTPAGKVLFGSVTQGVILGTRRPVLVCSTAE
jgi:nucleotide-binding universal stress UspA family protein